MEISCTLYPVSHNGTILEAIVNYYIWDIENDKIKIQNISITTRTPHVGRPVFYSWLYHQTTSITLRPLSFLSSELDMYSVKFCLVCCQLSQYISLFHLHFLPPSINLSHSVWQVVNETSRWQCQCSIISF